MPSMLDTPEYIEHLATHDLMREPPYPAGARRGFWRTLAHRMMTTQRTRTPDAWHMPGCHTRRRFETPLDWCVREYPYLAVYALAII